MREKYQPGDSLNRYPHFISISHSDPEELERIIKSIKTDFIIKALYFAQGKHFAWINAERKIKFVEKE